MSVSECMVRYNTIFEHSFNAIYYLEKKHIEKNYRFTNFNDIFTKELGYSSEEVKNLDPRRISDQSFYNPDIKYQPLLQKGEMQVSTVLVTKSGEKKFVKMFCKVFRHKFKTEILCIAEFLKEQIGENKVN